MTWHDNTSIFSLRLILLFILTVLAEKEINKIYTLHDNKTVDMCITLNSDRMG